MTTCFCPLCEYIAGISDECEFHLKDLCEECAEIVQSLEEEDDIPA